MAFRTQKISQMTPKGSDLEATDLIEVSTIESGSYVTRSITGQELIDAIPAPTGFVPTSRTLTINGTTQDLSADRTFTISTGITIGATAITSGTVGRVLFEGTGNVVQESANLFWDNTNGRLGIGTSSPTVPIHGLVNNQNIVARFEATGTGEGNIEMSGVAPQLRATTTNGASGFRVSIFGSTTGDVFRLQDSTTTLINVKKTGNVLIGTTTDAGFRLDVNGTARVSGLNGNMTFSAVGDPSLIINSNTGTLGQLQLKGGAATSWIIGTQDNFLSNALIFRKGATTTMVHTASGNLLINTTTDAGFRLDVNGTARVRGTGTTISTFAFNVENSAGTETFRVYDNGLVRVLGGQIVLNGSNGSLTAGFIATAGQIGAGTTSVTASAQLEVASTTRGFLPPRMTTTQKNAIATPATGLQVYDTTLNRPCFYDGTTWITL